LKTRLLACVIILLFALGIKNAAAQNTYVWQGGSAGSWETSTNWNIGGYTQYVGYPGYFFTNDIAQINTSYTNITVGASHTISQLNSTSYGISNITITFSGAPALTVTNGMNVAQPTGSTPGFIFSGSGTAKIAGTASFAYQAGLTINSGATVTFTGTVNLTNGSAAVPNAGTLNCSGCTFNSTSGINNTGTMSVTGSAGVVNFSGTPSYINNSGTLNVNTGAIINFGNNNNNITNASGATVVCSSGTLNLSGAGAYIVNSGTFKATATTFTFGNGNYIQNNTSSTFIMQPSCTFTMNSSSSNINNSGAWIDHRSTYTMGGQSAAIKNTGTMAFYGSNINMTSSGGGNGQNVTNSTGATLTADSTTNITCGTYTSNVTNGGTMYAGLSNSSCIISLTAQSAIVSNSGIFQLGSTSIIYPTAVSTKISNTGGTFTLMSDAYGSAAIGALNNSGGQQSSMSGSFAVQRYYQGSTTYNTTTKRWIERNYRIISSPVYNTTYTVSGVTNNVFGLNYIVGTTAGQTTGANSLTNAFITGCAGGSTTSGNPSAYLYRESITPSGHTFTSGNFLGITNITNSTSNGYLTCSDGNTYSLPVGTGVFFFFRGAATNFTSRTTTPYIVPDNVILTNTGTMNTFGVTAKDWYTANSSNLGYSGTGTGTNSAVRGFNMIGNPYPSTIDWCTIFSSGISLTNVNPTVYTFNPITNQYNSYLASSASGGTATGNASRYIVSGQGFFVQANAANPAVAFTENAKAPAQLLTGASLLMGTPVEQTAGSQIMRLQVSVDSVNNDDIALVFNSSAPTAFNPTVDARYLQGNNAIEGLSSFSSDNVKLSINSVPLPGAAPRVIRLSVNAGYTGTFTFTRTQLDEIPKLYDIWLMDKLKNDSLDIRNNATYAFDVSLADTTTYGDNRFALVIRQNPALMVHLLSFTATKAMGGSEVVWTTENEENYTHFTLQRSTDAGTTYTTLEGLVSSAQGTYSFLDANPVLGADSYRLEITDLNGSVTYSNVVTLTYATASNTLTASNITVYPNPTTGILNMSVNQTTAVVSVANQSSLQTAALNPGSNLNAATAAAYTSAYDIKIISITGNIVRSSSSTQPTWTQSVSDLQPGTYVIKVMNNKDNSLVGSGTFIKL
jgi:hypothetical protein